MREGVCPREALVPEYEQPSGPEFRRLSDRARALIDIADPGCMEHLEAEAQGMGLLGR